jgi:glycine/D-amino acid oxidase-like deaminating enzyme
MPSDSGPASVDAVVIGAGHNGLVAAATLADAPSDAVEACRPHELGCATSER